MQREEALEDGAVADLDAHSEGSPGIAFAFGAGAIRGLGAPRNRRPFAKRGRRPIERRVPDIDPAPRLGAIVITYREAANIGACLDGLAFCDEIVVVDRGSDDGTQAIAREKGARVIEQAWLGYGPQKNFALAQTTADWVLSVDADERVGAALAAEIRAVIAAPAAEGYEMPRLSSFLGRPMRHSGWYPDRVLRLFRRDKGRFTDDVVHERVVVEGRIGRLSNDLVHHPVRTIDQALARMDRYSTLGAEKLATQGRSASFGKAVARGAFAFLRTYVLQRGFLDGREGFILAVANAEGTYYRYLKAWLAGRERA